MTAGAMNKVREWRSNHSPQLSPKELPAGEDPGWSMSSARDISQASVTCAERQALELNLGIATEIFSHFFPTGFNVFHGFFYRGFAG